MPRNVQPPQQSRRPPLASAPNTKRDSPRCWRAIRYWYWRLLRDRSSPQYLARGLACGVFAGCFPLFGMQTLIGVLLAVVFRGHKIAAAVGTWISNPLTYVPIYLLNFQIGQWLLGSGDLEFSAESLESSDALLDLGAEFLVTLLCGCAFAGAILATLAYGGSVRGIRYWRENRARSRDRRYFNPSAGYTQNS